MKDELQAVCSDRRPSVTGGAAEFRHQHCRAEAVGAELAHIDVESSPILHIRYKAGGAFRMLITDARYAPEEPAGRRGLLV